MKGFVLHILQKEITIKRKYKNLLKKLKMRQIKFRAWDGKKMWSYAVPILGKAYNGGTINVSKNEDGGFNKFIEGVLLQFTGLYDCEGKEVYEGDLVQINEEKPFTEQVMFARGRFRITNYNGYSDDLWAWTILNKVEVIGNIYEHPDLLSNN